MEEKKGFLLQTVKQMNVGAGVSALGFALYLALSAFELYGLADLAAAVFGLVALYVFTSAAAGRKRDKTAVSYSLLWGTGALAILLCGFAVMALRVRLGR
jgi:cellobiose-specific phosphotransferase system component IIC